MKATLEFNLDDADDIRSHQRCVLAEDMALILWELQHNIHDRMYQWNGFNEHFIDAFYVWFNEEMMDRGINIDKLIV